MLVTDHAYGAIPFTPSCEGSNARDLLFFPETN
jgi:hypothetical protein